MPPHGDDDALFVALRSIVVSIVCERFLTGAEAFSAMRTAPGEK